MNKNALDACREHRNTKFANQTDAFHNVVMMEGNWFENQCPYFKMWPHILEKINELDLKIPVESFRVPFSTFAVYIPKGYAHNKLGCDHFSNMLFSVDFEENIILIAGKHDTDDNPYMFAVPLTFHTLEECFENEVKKFLHKRIDREASKFIFTTCICTAYFGIDAHEIMMPDIPRKYIDKYIRAKKKGEESEVQKILNKAKRMGLFGWKMGSEIDLPRPTINYIYMDENTDKNDEEKRELMYRHMRRGHIRAQACGEGMKDRVPVFIRPKMVRPDLPENPYPKGYRIGRKR
jgi:hypothetical protein